MKQNLTLISIYILFIIKVSSQNIDPVGLYISYQPNKINTKYTLTINTDSTYKCIVYSNKQSIEEWYAGKWNYTNGNLELYLEDSDLPYTIYQLSPEILIASNYTNNPIKIIYADCKRIFNKPKFIRNKKLRLIKQE